MTTTAAPLDAIITALRNHGCNPRQSRPGQYNSRCPNTAAHSNGDRNPSLSVGEGADGRALIHCQTGCEPTAVLNALGLGWHDAFPPPETNGVSGHQKPRVVDRYDYVTATGELVFQVERMDPKGFRQRRPDGNGGWVYNLRGVTQPPLYRADRVACALRNSEGVWVVEGEKDVHALEREGVVATTCPMGAEKWRPWHTGALTGATNVYVVADDDPKGHAHAQAVATALEPVVGHVHLHLPKQGHKDVAEHLGAGYGIDDLRPWPDTDDPPSEPEQDDDGRNWRPADLAAVYAAGLTRPQPDILRRSDGQHLLYSGKINTIFGESGGGKTWLAEIAVAQVVADGGHAIVLDYEDDAVTFLVRLQALGIPPEQAIAHTTYFPIAAGPTIQDLEEIDRIINERGTDLIVVDSTGEALAAQGLDQDRDPEVARWMATLPRRWSRLGPCVLLLDHVPKHGENRQEIGSQRKRSGINGASYELVQVDPFAAGQDGRMVLKVGKDRGGNYPKGTEQASITVSSTDDGLTVKVAVDPGSGKVVPANPTRGLRDYEEEVLRFVEETGPNVTQRMVERGVPGDNGAKRLALKTLVSRGELTVQQAGRAHLYSSVKDIVITPK